MPENDTNILKSPAGGTGIDEEAAVTITSRGINYIIAIGIDNYKNADLQLSSCENDCRELIRVLENKYENFQVYKTLFNEEATKDNIIKVIRDFRKNRQINTPLNNLIIFYSGHGDFIEAPHRKIGSWIPYDYTDNAEDEFLRLDNLLQETEFVNTTHLLIISDACYSGAIFELGDFFKKIDAPLAASDIGFEPSRWALVSSRKNEKSAAGGKGEKSAFTKELIDILEQKIDSRLLFSQVASQLRNKFSTDKIQKIDYEKLNISPQNSGEFIFEGKQAQINSGKRKQILLSGFMNLNYDDQRERFEAFSGNQKKLFTLFTGTPDCGLYHLSYLARTSTDFPKNYGEPKIISFTNILGDDSNKLLDVFSNAIKCKCQTWDQLYTQIFSILDKQSLLLEFRFYSDKFNSETESNFNEKNKSKLLDQLAFIVDKINDRYPDGNSLILFVIDMDGCAYEELYQSSTIGSIPAIFMPRIECLKLSRVKGWYNNMRNNFIADENKRIEFDTLFNESLYMNLKNIISENGEPPGSTIRKICNAVQCDELAEKILFPQQ